MSLPWLRLWHDMPNDPKWRVVSKASGRPIAEVLSMYVHLLVEASTADERGRTQANASEQIAAALDMETAHVDAIRTAMQGRVLDRDRITGWDRRQPKREDGSQERSKAWRDDQKRLQAERVGSELKQTQTTANDLKRRVDKDITSEAKASSDPRERQCKDGSYLLPLWIPEDEWDAFVKMRRGQRKPVNLDAAGRLLKKLEQLRDADHDPKAVIEESIINQWAGFFPLKNIQRGTASGRSTHKHTGFSDTDYHAAAKDSGFDTA